MLVSPAGVRCMWLRHDLETFRKRLKALEAKAAQEHLISTEDQLRASGRGKKSKPTARSKPSIPVIWGRKYLLRRYHQEHWPHLSADIPGHLSQVAFVKGRPAQ